MTPVAAHRCKATEAFAEHVRSEIDEKPKSRKARAEREVQLAQ